MSTRTASEIQREYYRRTAAAYDDLHVADSEHVQALPSERRLLAPHFDAPYKAGERAQNRGAIARACADIQHTLATSELESLEHSRQHVGGLVGKRLARR